MPTVCSGLICMSVCLSLCLSFPMSLSLCLSIYLLLCLSLYLSLCLPFCLLLSLPSLSGFILTLVIDISYCVDLCNASHTHLSIFLFPLPPPSVYPSHTKFIWWPVELSSLHPNERGAKVRSLMGFMLCHRLIYLMALVCVISCHKLLHCICICCSSSSSEARWADWLGGHWWLIKTGGECKDSYKEVVGKGKEGKGR